MYGSGAAIGMVATPVALLTTLLVLQQVHIAFCAAGRGSAMRSTAGWLIAATAPPAIAATTPASALSLSHSLVVSLFWFVRLS